MGEFTWRLIRKKIKNQARGTSDKMEKQEIVIVYNSHTSVFKDLEKALNFIRKKWNKIHYLSMRKVKVGSDTSKDLKESFK